MSSGRVLSKVGGATLRVVFAAAVLTSGGCAYFHPAFMTNASRLHAAGASGEGGVLVCERLSLTRSDCAVMPRSELNHMLSEMTGRY
jgi:hypothetical protein